MLLAFNHELVRTGRYDQECRQLADEHYSRQKPGTPQFCPPGELLVLRDCEARCVLSFIKQRFRKDQQRGIYCSIFRNVSSRLSSDILLECDHFIRDKWGAVRCFTFIDPTKVKSPNPGYCFKIAGWVFEGLTSEKLHVLAKYL